VERLTGLDAQFLYMETPTQHFHTLKISVLDPSTVPGGYSFENVEDLLATRLHLLPPFRQRAVEVPFHLHHPIWIEDPEFRLDQHVHRVVLDSPGNHDQFDAAISEIASRPLRRDRPLWELWVIEGMSGGRVGFVAKMHHCMADGVKAAELLLNVMETEPDAPDPPPPTQPWKPEPVPGKLSLAVSALLARLRQLLWIPGLLRRTYQGIRNVVRGRREGAVVAPPAPFSAPNTSFNRALTPNRLYSTLSLPLDECKAVKSAANCTVNDVVLAMVAGALRGWLEERGELPDKPLVAGVPVSTRTETTKGHANRVSNLFTVLPVQLADPLARLDAIHEVTKGAKEQLNLLGVDMLADWSELTPGRPVAAGIRFYSRHALADRHRPPINLVVSNVPGPTMPLYVAGARLVAIFSMGPILENVGLNVTVWSYLGDMNFGLVACPETIPDLPKLTARLRDALDELLVATGNRPSPEQVEST
jgi:diacylglycerol O-acyltransferase / wax synthase